MPLTITPLSLQFVSCPCLASLNPSERGGDRGRWLSLPDPGSARCFFCFIREFLLPTVTKCLLIEGFMVVVEVFSFSFIFCSFHMIVGSLT